MAELSTVADNSNNMQRLPILILCFFLISALFFHCTSDPFSPPLEVEEGTSYFPLAIGRSWTYQVDSVIYDPLGSLYPVDTVQSFIRESVQDSFSTPAGITYVILREGRRDSLNSWEYQKTIGVSHEQHQLLWQEDGRILIKLIFPVYNGMTWDGTAYFDPFVQIPIYGETMQPFKSWSFGLLGKQENHQVGPFIMDHVLRIRQADDENLIERRFSEEWYQDGIGLIYKKMMILDTQCGGNPGDCAGIPWEEKAEKGYILNQILIGYTE